MAGGLALLPSCLKESGKSSIALENIAVTLDEENLLADIAETIIPRTKTPGAKELKLQLYVLKMLDDCHEKTEQDQFIAGLGQLKDQIYDKYSKSFSKLSASQQKGILMALESNKNSGPELSTFYKIMKDRTIDGYLNSKYVMTKLIIWELVPGRYNGYFPVKSA